MNIFLTGGTGAIGSEIIKLLSKDSGNTVYFTFHQNTQKARDIEKQYPQSKGVYCDLGRAEHIERVKAELAGVEFNVIISNAFPKLEQADFYKTSWEKVQLSMDVGLKSHYELIQEFSRSMKKKKSGHIITILSSVVSGKPPAQMMAYVMAKYALLGFHKALAAELVRFGLRVNAVSPSIIRTDFISNLPDHYVRMVEESSPQKRLATAQDVAGVINFLVSRESAYVNGANIPVTGGM